MEENRDDNLTTSMNDEDEIYLINQLKSKNCNKPLQEGAATAGDDEDQIYIGIVP